MKKNLLLVSVLIMAVSSLAVAQNKFKALVVTGGHEFDHKAFYEMFDALGVSYDTIVQPKGNALIASDEQARYDVFVFYDMFDAIKPTEKEAYIRLLKKGKPMIFLHHSLAAYQHWPEFTSIVGGHYHTQLFLINGDSLKSNYEHDISMPVAIADRKHPITAGLDDFEIVDERYGDVEVLPNVTPLLTTSHPKSMKPLAWINHYGISDVIYIQLGHGPTAYANPNFRTLLRQAIAWTVPHHRKIVLSNTPGIHRD